MATKKLVGKGYSGIKHQGKTGYSKGKDTTGRKPIAPGKAK